MADWSENLPAAAAWSASLQQPYDDAPSFDPAQSPEVDTALRLAGDRSFLHRPSARIFADYRVNADAYAHLATMPTEGQTLHGVISGRYALYELIPALMERTGQRFAALTVATLSFNKQNATELLKLVDAGAIARFTLVISYYFKSTSREIYDQLVPPLRDRGHRVLAMRTHAKLLLAEMEGGAKFTVETSANLRSSSNVEQFALTRDAALHDFHRGWIQELLAANKPEEGT